MKKAVYSKEIILSRSADDMRLLLTEELKKKRRSHLSESTGLTAKISGKHIRLYYRYKKLEEAEKENIFFIPGELPDLTVHHKYAVAEILPVSETASKLHIDFVDDSKLYIRLAWIVFFSLFVLASLFLTFSIENITLLSASLVSLFFVSLWLLIAVVFTRSVMSEDDDTYSLLENEIEALIGCIDNTQSKSPDA